MLDEQGGPAMGRLFSVRGDRNRLPPGALREKVGTGFSQEAIRHQTLEPSWLLLFNHILA
jgi:hypothetical protein